MKRLIMLCCAACVAIVVMLFVGCNAENEFATAEKIQALLSEKKVEEALALVKEVQLTHPLVLHNVAVACSAASARRRFDNSFDNSKNGNKREDPLATALEATAAELFLKAATKGDVDSQYEVFEHEKRRYDEKYKEVSERKNGLDKESALKSLKIAPIALEMLEKAAKQGKGESDLLEIYRHGRYGIERDIPKAIKLIKSRAEKSEAHALCARDMIEIGQCFMCVEDLGKAGEWFEKAAEWFETTEVQEPTALSSSYSSDCKELAEYLLAVKKWELAIKWYKKAATAKDARKDAMVALYDIYSKGEIVPKDEEEALKWLKKAVDAGDSDATAKYGKVMSVRYDMYFKGDGLAKEKGEALLEWLKKAADAGDGDAKKKYEVIMRRRQALAKKDTPAQDGKAFLAVLENLPVGEMREQYCKLNRELLIANLRGVLDGSFMKAHSSFDGIDTGWEGFILIQYWRDGFILDESGWREVMNGVPLKKELSMFWLPAWQHLKPVPSEDKTTPRISLSVWDLGVNLWKDFKGGLNGRMPTDLKLQQFSTQNKGKFVVIAHAEIFSVSAERVLAWVRMSSNNEAKICVRLGDVEKDNKLDVSEEVLHKVAKHTSWSDIDEGQFGTIFGYVKQDNMGNGSINVEGAVFVPKN